MFFKIIGKRQHICGPHNLGVEREKCPWTAVYIKENTNQGGKFEVQNYLCSTKIENGMQ